MNLTKMVKQYCKNAGVTETKIFVLNSRDKFMLNVLKNRGWHQNTNISSKIYNLKWTYKDKQ